MRSILVLLVSSAALAADGVAAANESSPASTEVFHYDVRKGLDIRSLGGGFSAHFDLRAQTRFTHFEGDRGDSPDEFELNRARFKLGGHLVREELTYYTEYDFPSRRLLDLRFTLAPSDAVQLRFGQWKVPYNRERVDSSGNQQFVERSIVNDPFTLDRQRGVALFGRLWAGEAADSWYNFVVGSGNGRGASGVGARPLLLGRWQWNFLKRDLGFSQSDVGYRAEPAGSLALAAATWRGPYTAFSSAGGGELPGFAPGDDQRYDVRQAMLEGAYQHRGLSFQSELHWKRVLDTSARVDTELAGGYAQAGIFPHALWPAVPKPLELAVRYAQVDPGGSLGHDLRREATLCANWFFNGHRNKLSADFSLVSDDAAAPGRREQSRVRLQWDVSI